MANHVALGSRDGLCVRGAACGCDSGAWIRAADGSRSRDFGGCSQVDTAQIERQVEAQMSARVDAAVAKAVSEVQVKQTAELAKVLNAAGSSSAKPIWRQFSKPRNTTEKQRASIRSGK